MSPGPEQDSHPTAFSPSWPLAGALRVGYDPIELPRLGDEPGPHRFDDPRPRTADRFLIRYAASHLRGCLLELLAWLRQDPTAVGREALVDAHDPDLVPEPVAPAWQALADYLRGRRVVAITATEPSVVSIHDPRLHRELDREVGVRAILDSESARAVLLGPNDRTVHLDNAAVRLSSEVGRAITQACALALHDRPSPPDVIHYRSRHDDDEDCWAIYGRVPVAFSEPVELSPGVPTHVEALASVAALWSLALPPAWTADAEPRGQPMRNDMFE